VANVLSGVGPGIPAPGPIGYHAFGRQAQRIHTAKLLTAFQRLIENGASLLAIEHKLDVIRAADWVINLGPGIWPVHSLHTLVSQLHYNVVHGQD
jgi:hypothetical protein